MYSLEVLDLNVTLLNKLDEPMYNSFSKVFKSYDRNTIRSCMFYMGVLPLRYEYFCRKMRFFNNLHKNKNVLLSSLSAIFGQDDVLNTCFQFKINFGMLPSTCAKRLCWEQFENSLI